MKERYFTQKNISYVAKEMLNAVEGLKRERNLRPSASALLVLDMQRYFLEESSHAFIPSAPAIVPNILNLIRTFLESRRVVILTRHVSTYEDSGLMTVWWRDIINESNPLSEVLPELRLKGIEILKKGQYDAFHQTPLQSILRSAEVEQVVITGVMTHLCCETTARSAFVRGFEVFFPVDATATYNIEFHKATLLNLTHGFSTPLLTKDILKAFEESV